MTVLSPELLLLSVGEKPLVRFRPRVGGDMSHCIGAVGSILDDENGEIEVIVAWGLGVMGNRLSEHGTVEAAGDWLCAYVPGPLLLVPVQLQVQ